MKGVVEVVLGLTCLTIYYVAFCSMQINARHFVAFCWSEVPALLRTCIQSFSEAGGLCFAQDRGRD